MFDPLHKWLGIPPDQQPPNHYRLLGLAMFEHDVDVINAAADKQLSFLHQMTGGEYAAMAEDLANQISAARVCLTSDEKRVVYDRRLRAPLEVVSSSAHPDSIVQAPIAGLMSPVIRTTTVSVDPSVVAQPASRVVRNRARRSAAKRKRASGLNYWHYWILLCIVVLLGIAVALKRGLLTFEVGGRCQGVELRSCARTCTCARWF